MLSDGRPSQITWIGIWPRGATYVNVRYYELLRRFTFVKQFRLPPFKGITRLQPAFARLISQRYKWLFSSDLNLTRWWKGSLVIDLDDPTFSEAEMAVLNDPRVKVVVTTTEQLREEFIRRGVAKPIEVIPSGFSKRDCDHRLAEKLARTHNPQGHPVVGYSGSTIELHPSQPTQGDISLLVRAMERIWVKQPNIQLWLIGKASREVIQWAEGKPQVKLFGLVPRSELLAHLKNFTVATYPRRIDHGGRFSIKLIEYMGIGTPIVATPVSETEIVRQAEAGIFAETPEGFADAVLTLLRDRSQRELMARKALRFSAPYDWDLISKQYENQVFLRYCK